MMGSLPHEPTRLEQLAELAGMAADDLRQLWREEIEDARAEAEEQWRVEQQRILAEAFAESALPVAETANDPIYHPSTRTG